PEFSVGIVSGRSLSGVKSLVGVNELYYAGNHGFEIDGPGLNFIHSVAKATRPELEAILQQLSAKLAGINGVIIEDKGLSLSVHYRLVKNSEEEITAQTFHMVTAPWLRDGKIRVTSGKKVWEIRPPIDWHKGKAVEIIIKEMETFQGGAVLPVYLGDDTTDEDAFKVVHHPRGWGIFVGEENAASNADYYLNSTSEVALLLSRLLDLK
ncbi:trehalose-phosphatase, partial [Chloroflexota bacterium]